MDQDDNPKIIQLIRDVHSDKINDSTIKKTIEITQFTLQSMGKDSDIDSIVDFIGKRMKFGYQKYGHGLRANDDTTQWGTKDNSWLEMLLEETTDAINYACAHRIRMSNT
jgi:TRAP-type uncharacterized transport system substrate-binding protein